MPTRKISTKEIEEEAKKSEESSKNKKQNKLVQFIKRHKKLSIFIGLVLLFVLSVIGTIVYSRITNPKEVLLPNLVGINKQAAEQMTEELGLEFNIIAEEYNSEYAEDFIISQDPEYIEDYNVKEGSSINVVVSKGIEQAIVPDVVGKSKQDAIKLIEDAKLKYEIVEEESKKIESGYVISQETEKNTEVFAGDTLVIHVSTGIKKSAVSSVIGKSESDAKSTLTSLGLKVEIAYEEDTSKENGTVLKQSIDAGKEVEEGTKIVITVNKLTETKSATLTVNVKSLLGGKVEYEETSNTTTTNSTNDINGTNTSTSNKVVKNVEVKIVVAGDTVYKSQVDPTTTNLVQTISGKGTVTVKVYIDDVLKSTRDINLNNENSLTIE